jgi:hypothetical protein
VNGQLHDPAVYPRGKNTLFPLDTRQISPLIWSERGGEEKNSQTFWGKNFDLLARSLIATLTEISQHPLDALNNEEALVSIQAAVTKIGKEKMLKCLMWELKLPLRWKFTSWSSVLWPRVMIWQDHATSFFWITWRENGSIIAFRNIGILPRT